METYLLFGIHGHQPVGNFPHIFEEALKKAYEPFLKILMDFPEIKVTLHYTGPLLLWFESKAPYILDIINRLIERDQVEIVISGFYEPVLSAIREEDRILQIEKAKEFVKKKFGYAPCGLWLTERVWESEVLSSLYKCGIRYVVVDDTHFLYTGLDKNALHGYYLTESEGNPIAVFPIDEKLRYLIPFRPVEETFKHIKEIESLGKGNAAIIFDDAEKFGLWPFTYEWVYGKNWLKEFFGGIVTKGVKTQTFSEYLKKNPPLGRVYLPTTSYFEMGEWSLPGRKALLFERWVKKLREEGVFDKYRCFVKGGIWKNFFLKYDEANRMHKKMLYLSKNVRKIKNRKKREKALEALLKAQCNDAYWHGIFGGLYLPHLRHEVYRNLIKAEKELEKPFFDFLDLDLNGKEEIYVRERDLTLLVYPHKGGGIYEYSVHSLNYNLLNTLMRRYEHYHEGLSVGETVGEEAVSSIHEISKKVDKDLIELLNYDDHERGMFLERLMPEETSIEDVVKNSVMDIAKLYLYTYEFKREENRLTFKCRKSIDLGIPVLFDIEKTFRIFDGHNLEIQYKIEGEKPLKNLLFAVEINISLPSSDSDMGKVISGDSVIGNFKDLLDREGIEYVVFKDPLPFTVGIESDVPFRLWIYPVYTVSQSEAGFDKTYQETCVYLVWKLAGGFNFRNYLKFIVKK